MPSPELSSGHFALTGMVSRPPLCVNIVRLKNALSDASELSRRALKLESVLLGELLAEEYPEDDEKPPSSAITVVPVDFSTLAVVSDEEHESAVGLYLARIAASGLADFLVHAARNADDNEQAIRSLLPNLLERALEYLPSERWTILGRAPDGLRLVRRRGDAALTSSPFHLLENPTLDVLNFTATPALDWGGAANGGDRVVFPAIRPATIRMQPLGSIVAMLQNAQVSQTVIDTFRAGGDAQLCENEDLVAVTAVPLLHKEARILSLLRRIPDAYGFESLDAYYADFSARYELVDGVPEMTWHDDDNGGDLFAELRFCDDDDERVRRLWPASLLLGRAGATEIPASMNDAEAAAMLTDLADDLRGCPDRLGIGMNLDGHAAGTSGKGRSRGGAVATYEVPTTTPHDATFRLASQSKPLAPLKPRLEVIVEDESPSPLPVLVEPIQPGTAPRAVKVASFKTSVPTRAPLQPVTPTDANARDDDGDRLPSVDADPKAVYPKPKVRKLVMSKHANSAPQTPAKPMAKPADETADEAADDVMIDEMAAYLTEMDAAQPEMAGVKRKAYSAAMPPAATKAPKKPNIPRPVPAVLPTKPSPEVKEPDRTKAKRAPRKVVDPDEADAKIRKEHSEGGDLNKITGDEFKAFLTKAGEKPKGGLSKMPKPKLRELVDAVLARSQ
ncbi:predicted protein [Micromonas commoda]|uniref:Uncharacterized protein n=1 Tax=Micromonas commoda (strain RCC299 / NOUM17 / CCMP2709) TaxID=296587 RepID=C1E3S6_MICCC|nr:predicted protein [Micromonas commoda]ACO62604.1 predicted protein [Micromonas commoda]|eukprot:XP_002501346.1 predicted protein [Micromonas commoda]